MKTIKKVAIAVAIAVVASSASFAQKRYSGDVQLQLGWQGAIANVFRNRFYLAASNWNLWRIDDRFSVGFYDKFDLAVGSNNARKVADKDDYTYHNQGVAVTIGGAAEFFFNDTVKFRAGVGIPFGYDVVEDTDSIIGIALDAQAKFIPHYIASPLVGFQIRWMGPFTAALYVGGSYNFGVR